MRRWLVLVSLISVAVIAYLGTSYAIASDPAADLPESLPASELPKQPVPEADRVAINNQLIPEVLERAGISPESFDNARVLAITERGPLYVIPGTRGVCLALADSVGCAQIPPTGPLVTSLLVGDATNTYRIGGGLLSMDAATVIIRHTDGSTSKADSVEGGFVITSRHRMRLDEKFIVVGQ